MFSNCNKLWTKGRLSNRCRTQTHFEHHCHKNLFFHFSCHNGPPFDFKEIWSKFHCFGIPKVYPNNYCQIRHNFKVKGLQQDISGKNVLKLSHASYSKFVFTAFVGSVKLEWPGLSNQLFVNDTQKRREEVENTGANDVIGEYFKPVEDGAVERLANGKISACNDTVIKQGLPNNATSDSNRK